MSIIHVIMKTTRRLIPLGLGLGLRLGLSAAFFHDKSSITIGGGGYESAIAPKDRVAI